MKNFMQVMLAVLLLAFGAGKAGAQTARAQKAKIMLPTVADEQCKTTIENSVWKQVDGVLAIDVKVKGKYANVTFMPDRISLDNLRLFIADLGYDADGEKADPEAIKLLPKECRAHILAPPPPPKKGAVSDTLKAAPPKPHR